MRPKLIVFTDLDGTLLEHETYAFTEALPALEHLSREEIPLVLCSSKTRPEIERWREALGNGDPFISENGGGIFITPLYFREEALEAVWPGAETVDAYRVLVLGTPYAVLRGALRELRDEGFELKGFGDMDAAEVAEITGLSLEEAGLARMRDFDEPFAFCGGEERLSMLLDAIERRGLGCTSGGRLYHLMGNNDKGKAVAVLTDLFRQKLGDISTVALGDSLNDLPMLERVDYPILVRDHRGEHDPRIAVSNLIKADGIGPEGWRRAVLELLQRWQ